MTVFFIILIYPSCPNKVLKKKPINIYGIRRRPKPIWPTSWTTWIRWTIWRAPWRWLETSTCPASASAWSAASVHRWRIPTRPGCWMCSRNSHFQVDQGIPYVVFNLHSNSHETTKVCPRSLDPFYTVSFYVKWFKNILNIWTCSKYNKFEGIKYLAKNIKVCAVEG